MSDDLRKSRALDALVEQAKTDLKPDLDLAAMRALEDRIVAAAVADARERNAIANDLSAPIGRGRALRIGALALAAAAAVAVFVRKEPDGALLDGAISREGKTALEAGSLKSTEGAGEVRVGGVVASVGHVLRAGDLIETDRARAVAERPRKVTWLIEGEGSAPAPEVARARVKSAGETLVLGLEAGAIEAQVTPVATGEAFAVDVASGDKLVRVAVHGTHLRVGRVGSRVTVDLTEGVVSIGVPPRAGSTYGALVTAPAHVELDANDLDGTLRIDHAPSSVRLAVSLSPHETPAVAQNDRRVAAEPPRSPLAPQPAPQPAAPIPRPTDLPAAAPAKPDPAAAALPPKDAIAAAVKECVHSRTRSNEVKVTVTSTLRLKVGASGDVETAQFDPPLLPEIQTCAAAAIYKAKLAGSSGMVTIPIEFSY